MLNILTAERMTHRSSCPLQSVSLPTVYTTIIIMNYRKKEMAVLLISHCLCYPDCTFFVLLICSLSLSKKKIILIVLSIIQCFYRMCMFIYQILDDIFKWFNMLLTLFISEQQIQRLCGYSFKNNNFQLTGWNPTKETNTLFCLSSFPFGLKCMGASLTAHRNTFLFSS